MNRRLLLQSLAGLVALPLLPAILRGATLVAVPPGPSFKPSPSVVPLKKSNTAWRALLPPAAYNVLFEEGTERPFTSPLNDQHNAGTFVCAACYLPLFQAANKFDSGTGWPSFTQGIVGHFGIKSDHKLIMQRTEYHCARCGGHQGHIFDDGPSPRGERWCNNGVALNFIPQGHPFPALRT